MRHVIRKILGKAQLALPTPRSEGAEVELMLDEYGRAEIVSNGSIVSDVNSSVANLLADGVFPGEWVDTIEYSSIIVSVKASHVSATDGLHIHWSADGVSEDDSDTYTIPASNGKTFNFQPAWRYVKVEYTNSGDDQTSFILQTQLKKTPVRGSTHRVADNISGQDDAELMKSVISGADPNGTFRNVQTTVDGTLLISDNSSGLAIARGDVTGFLFVHKFGAAPDFDQADGEITVWDGASDAETWQNMVYDYSVSNDIDSLSSSDDTDTQNIEVQGLDTNYDLVTQTITLTGQTRKALDTPLIRVFRLKNVGSTDIAGHVFCYPNTAITLGVPDDSSKIRALVHNGNNQTEMAVYTIPDGYTGYLRSFFASTAGAKKDSNYIIKLYVRPFGQVFQLKHRSAVADSGTSHFSHNYMEPEVIPGKADVMMTAEMAAASTGAAVASGFDIVLIPN